METKEFQSSMKKVAIVCTWCVAHIVCLYSLIASYLLSYCSNQKNYIGVKIHSLRSRICFNRVFYLSSHVCVCLPFILFLYVMNTFSMIGRIPE